MSVTADPGGWSAYHIRSRMLVLRLAEKIGGRIEWMCTGGRPLLLTLALATASLLWLDWWRVLLLYVALLLVWFAAKAKTRVVIETFGDHTSSTVQFGHSDDSAGTADRSGPHRLDASGMAGLLAAQLAEMRSVYQLLEEPLGRPHPGPVESAVQLEDIGDVLRSAFTTQSNLSIGPVTLPFGGLMALLGRLIQAPRLRGAIYGDDRDLTLTAALKMQGRDYIWKVSRRVDEAETPTLARTQMVGELAYRVFTELSLRGQAEWPATRYWLDALNERQACQRTPGDRRLHLERAETHLRNALAEDERFYLAAYNLGIVYVQLAEEDAECGRISDTDMRSVPDDNLQRVAEEPHMRSALNVFAYTINKLDHDRWEAYYGLALAHWKLAERSVCDSRRRWYKEVDDFGDRACKLAPGGDAREGIQNLKAMALRELRECRYNRVVDFGDRACKLTSDRDVCAQIRELQARALRELDAARRRYNRVVDLCDRAGELPSTSRAARAQIQDLKARALRELRALGKDDDPLSADLSDDALSACHSACESILRELTLAQLWRVSRDDRRISRLRKQASQYLLNLAVTRDAVAGEVPLPDDGGRDPERGGAKEPTKRSIRALVRALADVAERLADIDADAHAEIANIALKWKEHEEHEKEYKLALKELQRASLIDPDNAIYWAKLANLCVSCHLKNAKKRKREIARAPTFCIEAERAIDFGSATEQEEAIELLGEVYKNLGNNSLAVSIHGGSDVTAGHSLVDCPTGVSGIASLQVRGTPEWTRRARDLARRRKLSRRISALPPDPDAACKELEWLEGDGDDWEAAFVERHLGQQLLKSSQQMLKSGDAAEAEKKAAEAEEKFVSAIGHLECSGHADDIRRWGLYAEQAFATVYQSRPGDALPLAELGVAINPLSGTAWCALAIVRERGGDYDGACTAWSRAHFREPEDPDYRVALALCKWQHAMWVANTVERRRLLREALVHLRGALVLYDAAQKLGFYDAAQKMEKRQAAKMEKRQAVEWWLAMCHWTLGEFTEMPSHLWFIVASLEKSSLTARESALKALVELVLAQSYRQTRHFADAEYYAQRSKDDGDKAAAGMPANTKVAFSIAISSGAPLREDRWPLGAIRARALAELAGCHADRSSGEWPVATGLCSEAEQLLAELAGCHADRSSGEWPVATGLCSEAEQLADGLTKEAVIEIRCEILTERGRIELACGYPDKAVNLLEQATGKDAGSAGSYVALACAYERLAAERHFGRGAALEKARESCKRAKEIVVDETHLQWQKADEIEQRLNASRGLANNQIARPRRSDAHEASPLRLPQASSDYRGRGAPEGPRA